MNFLRFIFLKNLSLLNYLLIIRQALFEIGFEDLANNLTYEIMTSKFLNF